MSYRNGIGHHCSDTAKVDPTSEETPGLIRVTDVDPVLAPARAGFLMRAATDVRYCPIAQHFHLEQPAPVFQDLLRSRRGSPSPLHRTGHQGPTLWGRREEGESEPIGSQHPRRV